MMKNEVKAKKNIIFGITIPTAFLEHETIKLVQKRYLRNINWLTIVLVPIPFISLCISSFSISFTIIMMWLLIVIGAYAIPFIKANDALKKLKMQNEWVLPEAGTIKVDLKAAANKAKKVSVIWYLIAIIGSFVPVFIELIYSKEKAFMTWNVITLLGLAAISILCFVFHLIMTRQRSEVISSNTDFNQAITRIRSASWSSCMLQLSFANMIFIWVIWAYIRYDFKNTMVFLGGSVVYSIAIIIIALYAEFKARKLQYELTYNQNVDIVNDEDDNWIYGMIYYNPNDSRLMVTKRVGAGTTTNLAKPVAKALMAFVIIVILSLPVMCIWMMFQEFTPIKVEVKNNQIIAEHLKEEYVINIEDIESVQLLNELPRTYKRNGTNMDNLYKGIFTIDGFEERCTLFLNPENTKFLVVKTADKTYIMSGSTDEETMELESKIMN